MTNFRKNLQDLKEGILNRITLGPKSKAERLISAAQSIRAKQLLLLSSGAALVLIGGLYLSLGGDENPHSPQAKKPTEKMVSTLATPLSPVDERETWVSRVEKQAESIRQETAQIREANQVLLHRVDVLEDLLKVRTPAEVPTSEEPKPAPPIPPSETQASSQRFPPIISTPHKISDSSSNMELPQNPLPKKQGPKIVHLAAPQLPTLGLKSPDTYLPAGTYCKAVVDMGIAASTATNAQGNPEPIKLRLVDDGTLPGGIKGDVKDAVL